MDFFIRVDGNREIGTGHVMRCLSIADELKKHGINCIFICADSSMENIFFQKGFQYIILNSVWNDLDKETAILTKVLIESNAKKILIDSYFVTSSYLKALQLVVETAYMDDLNLFTYPCDYLINYNIYAKEIYAKSAYPFSELLLGTKYFPIREEFSKLKKYHIRERVENVTITTGGTDQLGVALAFAEKIVYNKKYGDIKFHLVLGTFNNNKSELEQLAENCSNIKLHFNTNNISELFYHSDIAISAGGTTVYELCYVGVPTILYAIADNQLMMVESFSKQNIIPYAGDMRTNMAETVEKSLNYLDVFIKVRKSREESSNQQNRMVDSDGCQRIINELKLLI